MGDLGSVPGLGKSPEKGMATHPAFLSGESPWTEEPGGLQTMESHKVGYNRATKDSTGN